MNKKMIYLVWGVVIALLAIMFLYPEKDFDVQYYDWPVEEYHHTR